MVIQGYRALLAWREAAGQKFEISKLVQALQSCCMADVAEVARCMIQGYGELLASREAAGQEFIIGQLVQTLQSCGMEDAAKVATSLTDSKSFIFQSFTIVDAGHGVGCSAPVASPKLDLSLGYRPDNHAVPSMAPLDTF